MKRAVLVGILLAPFIWSCASAPVEPVKYGYEKDAIELHLKADKQLNYKDKRAHALVICVYQLMSPNAFNQLSGSKNGLYSLLECSVFDPAGVAVSKQIVVNPGKDMDMKLDRAEGAKYVALVAGYYTIDKDKITRLYQIPEISERSGFLWLNKTTRPDKLFISLILGSKQIQDPLPAQETKSALNTHSTN
jgi:type VI secretion system VasD/TssJ family lipoprotein